MRPDHIRWDPHTQFETHNSQHLVSFPERHILFCAWNCTNGALKPRTAAIRYIFLRHRSSVQIISRQHFNQLLLIWSRLRGSSPVVWTFQRERLDKGYNLSTLPHLLSHVVWRWPIVVSVFMTNFEEVVCCLKPFCTKDLTREITRWSILLVHSKPALPISLSLLNLEGDLFVWDSHF